MTEDIKVITTARAVILDQNSRLLLVKNANGNFWYTPGGWLDGFETLHECCMREVYEELGLEISVGALLYLVEHRIPRDKNPFDENVHKIEHYFSCRVVSGKINENGDENIWHDTDNGYVKYAKFFTTTELCDPSYVIAPRWLAERNFELDAKSGRMQYFPFDAKITSE